MIDANSLRELGGADQDSADQLLVGELAGAAAAIDQAATSAERTDVQPDGAPAAAAVVIDWRAEAHDLVDFTTGMLFPLYPRLETVWTPTRCATLEGRLAAVLQKHNLDMGKLLGKWGPEIMLVATIAPAVMPTVRAVKDDLAELREKAREQARAAPPAGQAAPPPAPNVRTTVQDAAAQPDGQAKPPPDTTKLHAKV